MIHFIADTDDESHGEFYSHDGSTTIWLGGLLTIWDLIGILVHESLHDVLEQASDPDETSEKQDHYIIQRLCF